MNLQDFVSDALREIVQGVRSVQEEATELGAFIGPEAGMKGKVAPSPVEFDVAVTTREESSSEAGGGLRVAGFGGAGVKGASGEGQETVSRIRFEVQVALPMPEGHAYDRATRSVISPGIET